MASDLTATPGRTVVAVPARDESERVGACVTALLDQRGLDGAPLPEGAVSILVYANNCRDGTAAAARGAGGRRVEVLEVDLPAATATAGGARRAAMDAAAARLPGSGLICTTDADSRPRPDWIAKLWSSIDGGAQAVAGTVDFDPAETQSLRFGELRRLEARYAALQAEIAARIDPEPHNPWPNHIWAWGANLAVTADAYHRVGGLPARPLAEDRAFVEALRRHDVPVRHCLEARVWTSARRVGRAAGGLASLVDDHAGEDRAPCDAALEPAADAFLRAAWRRRLRLAHAAPPPPAGHLCDRLGLTRAQLSTALAQPSFGAAWAEVEAASSRLRRRRMTLANLPREVGRAERLLTRLGRSGDPSDRVRAASAGLWSGEATPP